MIKVRIVTEKEAIARCLGFIALYGWEPYKKQTAWILDKEEL